MHSLRARLFAAIALATVAAVAVSLILGAWLVRRQVRAEAVRALSRQADLIAKQQRTAKAPGALGTFLETQQERLAIVGRDQAAQLLPDAGAAALRRGRGSEGTVTVRGTRFLYAARPSGRRAIVLLRAERLQSEDWSPFGLGLVLAGLVGVVIAATAAFVLARALSLPLARVAAASRRLAAGERYEPLSLSGPTEVVALARAFDEMAADLDRARAAQRAFLLSVSHELKTPLTAIQGHAEALQDEVVSPQEVAAVIVREGARLERLVRDLLDLARLDAHAFRVQAQPVDLVALAREAVQRFEPQARGFGVTLEATASGAAPASADPDRVLQILANLIENALRATPEGGSVTVRAEAGVLTVEDTGPGLEPEDLERAFDRFVLYERYGRLGRAVGTGLGLAIVRELAEAMGGRVAVESKPGAGASFRVTLQTTRLGA